MQALDTALDGPVLLAPRVLADERGFFCETFRESTLAQEHGITERFVQDNHSRSRQGTLRGLHFAVGAGVSKLVRCARGAVVDVLVDVRRDSPAFGAWEAYELTDENMRVLYAPVGFAHGFAVTSAVADVIYKQSAYYDPVTERCVSVHDPEIGIIWPDIGVEPLLSDRDRDAPLLHDILGELVFTGR
jgi:dTDP-4-dehydrorhamnose 3,5-epimerase